VRKHIVLMNIFCVLFFISGCQTAAERHAQIMANDRSKCSAFGFKLGSTEFSNCMMQQDATRSAAREMRKEIERASKCAEIRNTTAYGVSGGIAQGLALGLNGC
jgi:hypothetical protein